MVVTSKYTDYTLIWIRKIIFDHLIVFIEFVDRIIEANNSIAASPYHDCEIHIHIVIL